MQMIASFFVEVNCSLYFRLMSRFPLLNSSSLTLALFPFLFPLPKEIYKERPFPPLLPSFSPSLASLARDIHYSSLRSLSVSYVYTFYVFFFS